MPLPEDSEFIRLVAGCEISEHSTVIETRSRNVSNKVRRRRTSPKATSRPSVRATLNSSTPRSAATSYPVPVRTSTYATPASRTATHTGPISRLEKSLAIAKVSRASTGQIPAKTVPPQKAQVNQLKKTSPSTPKQALQSHVLNSWNVFAAQSKTQQNKPNGTFTPGQGQAIQSLGPKNRTKSRATDFLTLPSELRHIILQLSFDNLSHLTSFRKSAYGTKLVAEWTKTLRGVGERLLEDIDYIVDQEYEWNATYLEESKEPGYVDEIELAVVKAFQAEKKRKEEKGRRSTKGRP